MTEKKVSVSARVRVELEIEVSDAWSGDCNLAQVHKQGLESALMKLNKLVDSSGKPIGIRLLGSSVTAILVER